MHSIFLDALEHAVGGTGYSVIDGPSSLFALINDGDGIVSRCDLSVVCYDSPRDLRYLRHEENGGYGFMEHRLGLNIDSAVDRILEDDPDN